jgi:hypothetical protein
MPPVDNAEQIIITKGENGYIIETRLFEPEQIHSLGTIVQFGVKRYIAHNLSDVLHLTKEKLDAKPDPSHHRNSKRG